MIRAAAADVEINAILAGERGGVARALILAIGVFLSSAFVVAGVFLVLSIPNEPPSMRMPIPPALGSENSLRQDTIDLNGPKEVGVPRQDGSGTDYISFSELQSIIEQRRKAHQ